MKFWTACMCSFVFLLAGCEFSTQDIARSDEEVSQQAFLPASSFMRFYSLPASPELRKKYAPEHQSEAAARTQRRTLMRAHLEALDEIGALAESRKVPNADELEGYQHFLARHVQAGYHFLLEQSIAFFITEPILLEKNETGQDVLIDSRKGSFSEDELRALSFSTRLLLKNDNPNADLIATSLTALDGYWSKEEIRSSARQARAAALAWLEEVCGTCNSSLGKAYPDAANQRHAAIVEATHALEKMSR